MAFLNYENKRGSGKKLKVHFDLPEDDDYPISHQRDSNSSISSDSSLDSDDESEKNDNNSIDNNESKNNDGNGYGSPVWSYQGGSVTQSPPMQMMSPSGYDPNRIPSSIFSSPSPMEWSVASNESLFSIHLGNTSFSRDYAFTLNKSGELPRTNDLASMPTTLPPVQEVAHDKQVVRHSVSSDTSEETASLVVENDHKKTESSAEVDTTVLDKTPKDHSKEAMVPGEEAKNYTSASYRSVESDRSFQFPM